jgi:hypothetical protein
MATWKQRNGTEINISAMTDKHLVNTILMLRRNSRNVWWAVHKELRGVAALGIFALYATEGAMDDERVFDPLEEPHSFHPQYEALMEEVNRRKLTIPKLPVQVPI